MAVDASSVGILAGLVAAPLCWMGIVQRRRAMGNSAAVAHVVGACAAPFVLLAVFGLFHDPSLFALFFASLVFAPLVLFIRPRWPAAAPAITDPEPVVARPPQAPPSIDLQALEATRRQSLDALRRATKARAADKRRELSWEEQHRRLADEKRGRPIDDPLASWKRTAPGEPMMKARAAPAAKTKGRKLDVVHFDYINGDGEYSSRRVVVRVIAGTYFEGIDTEISETRTFRYDRVVGCLTSELSGEVALPKAWAAGFR